MRKFDILTDGYEPRDGQPTPRSAVLWTASFPTAADIADIAKIEIHVTLSPNCIDDIRLALFMRAIRFIVDAETLDQPWKKHARAAAAQLEAIATDWRIAAATAGTDWPRPGDCFHEAIIASKIFALTNVLSEADIRDSDSSYNRISGHARGHFMPVEHALTAAEWATLVAARMELARRTAAQYAPRGRMHPLLDRHVFVLGLHAALIEDGVEVPIRGARFVSLCAQLLNSFSYHAKKSLLSHATMDDEEKRKRLQYIKTHYEEISETAIRKICRAIG